MARSKELSLLGMKNRVHEARMQEAISIAALARLANLSERTTRRVEDGGCQIALLTKAKIVKAFNGLPDKQRKYTQEYLFPED